MARRQHQVRPTLLAVGEGDGDCAFLKHLRSLYCSNGVGYTTTIRNAHGKGPEHVIDFAAQHAKIYRYDRVIALLDTDIPWSDKLLKTARRARIEIVGSTPCLEGLLLSILQKQPPAGAAACKKAIQQAIGVDLTESRSYAHHFTRSVLDTARAQLPELDKLIGCLQGEKR